MSETKLSSLGRWLPLLDYALKKGVSLSTLRRHIKAKKVIFKIDGGKYYLLDAPHEADGESPAWVDLGEGSSCSSSVPCVHESELQRLERDLTSVREEIAELKTLIALYEEKIPQIDMEN